MKERQSKKVTNNMTDKVRISAFIIILEKPVAADDIQATLKAIEQIKGVVQVMPQVSDPTEQIAYERARQDIGSKILEVLYPAKV